MTAQEIIEKIRAEIEHRRDLNYKYYVKQGIGSSAEYRYDEDIEILSLLSFLEQEEKPKRVRTLEEEFDGYNPIVVTLDKYVLGGIGVGRHDKVIIKIQRKED